MGIRDLWIFGRLWVVENSLREKVAELGRKKGKVISHIPATFTRNDRCGRVTWHRISIIRNRSSLKEESELIIAR